MHPISIPCLAPRFQTEVCSLLYRVSRYITFQKVKRGWSRLPEYHGTATVSSVKDTGVYSGKKISGNHQDRYYLTKSPHPLVVGSDSAGCGNSVGARKDPADHTSTHGIVIEDLLLSTYYLRWVTL
ncbi:hypothetical protein BDV36DRAFT_262404 [Aspergillus pseudocaelatus]|uniref:Uncharacterized protein n=1 Tax=Aspergillus pseudocaelatus TaxID=1825620 RepID=A0ABQ6WEZ4_9EURO|nr:hypothetical protein BDV36DRAFT_262404 [Aspergillus pseudocaelatus]